MKIAIFTDSFYPTINGVVVSTICFINELTKLGHQIQVYCPHLKGVKNLTIENVEIIPLRGIPALFYPDFKFTTFSTPKVISKIKKFNPDIIHFHTQFVIGFKGIMVGKIFKIPIIGTYHTNISNEGYLKNIKMDNIEFIKKYAHKYNNLYYQNADLVLAPSVDSQDELIKDGIDNNKIKILFNPLPLEEKTDKKVFLKGVSGDIVLYVGRIAKEKNIEKAMEIFIEASKKRTNLKFVLVGDGPIKNKLENEIKEKGLENKIIFLGMIGHKDLVNSDIFEKSKIFLTASLSETFGITIIESLYFGVPVVGFKKGGLKDLIKNGYNGMLFEIGDTDGIVSSIEEIINNKEQYEKYRKNSKEFVKRFDAKKLTLELVDYYNLAIEYRKNKKNKRNLFTD